MFFFITERTCHSTTTTANNAYIIVCGKVENIKGYFLIGQGVLVAMVVYFYLSGIVRELCGGNISFLVFAREKLFEQKRIHRNSAGFFLIRIQRQTFILSHKC